MIRASGRLLPNNGTFSLVDRAGERWMFKTDSRTPAYLGKRVIVEGEVIGKGRIALRHIWPAE
jgi:hypothetical protein